MSYQPTFKLGGGKSLLPLFKPNRKAKPPPPKNQTLAQKLRMHWVFDKIHLYPEPHIASTIQYPPRCPQFHWMFKTEQDVKQWLADRCLSNVWRIWLCAVCKHWHYECYPVDLTGTTSGKCVRKEWWLVHKKGYVIELDKDGWAEVVKPGDA